MPTPRRRLSLLVVEDEPGDANLVRVLLEEVAPGAFDVHVSSRLADALSYLAEAEVDCVLLDLSLPDAHGLQAPQRIRAASDVPIIVLSGEAGVVAEVSAVAEDYLIKGEADGHLISRAVAYAIERRRATLELAHQALHDELTGLANRALLLDRLGLAVTRFGRNGSTLAVLFCDLDRFKVVNDSLGHDVGDQLLIAVAQRLSAVLRATDTAARFGGDEFVVLCEEVGGEQEAVAVAGRIAAAIAEPLVLGDEELRMSASIGIALADTLLASPDALLRDADAAMYRAKERGGGCQVFDPGMRQRAVRRLATETALHRALDGDELRLHYQPQVDLGTGRTTGVEALVRWQHPDRGLLAPAEFLGVAEESGLVHRLGAWVLHQACRQSAAWGSDVGVSVNLSAREVLHPGLGSAVAAALEATGCDPAALRLEITETAVMDDVATIGSVLTELKELGPSLALDDFGTGYSSLRALQHFPFDVVKIDRSFVAGMEASAPEAAIVAAVISLSHALGLDAVAEGIETQDHRDRLQQLGCDTGQGFFFARPRPAEDVELVG